MFVSCFACGLPTISRLPKNIGLFCKKALYKRRYSAKETYNFKEPTNRSHPICISSVWRRKTVVSTSKSLVSTETM